MLQKIKPVLKKYSPALIAVGSMLVAGTASAAVGDDITAAIDAGKANVTLVAAGLIGIAAIMTAVGIVVSALKR